MGPVFGSWVTAWVSSGCGFFLGCDRCLKGLWVVVGSGVWVVVVDRQVGMKWVVGRGLAAEMGGWSLVVVGSWLGCG